jgi:hypothetical protein
MRLRCATSVTTRGRTLPRPDSRRRQTPRFRLLTARAVVGAALLSPLLALPVLAQETTEPGAPPGDELITVSLELTGPSGCGSESDLAARIAWRTSRVRIVPLGASERRLEVVLETAPGSATATLSLTLPNGRRATRVLRAATCDEAVDAAALVAAVTLDPTASTAPTTPLPDAGAGDAGGKGGAGGTGVTPPPPVSTARPPEPPGGSGGTGGSRSELSGALFVPAALVTGPAPAPLYGVGAGAIGVWDRGSLLSPALRVSYVHFFGQEFDELGGTAYFGLDAVTIDVCPLRVGNELAGFFTCGSFTAGELTAEGRNTDDPQLEKLRWLTVGGTLLLELRPVEFLEVELFGTLGPPLVRDSFQFGCAPDAADCNPNLFHEVPALSSQGGIALGVFFR